MYQFLGTTYSQVLLWRPKTCTKTAAIVIIISSSYWAYHIFVKVRSKLAAIVIDKDTEQPIWGAVVKIESDGQILAETTTG